MERKTDWGVVVAGLALIVATVQAAITALTLGEERRAELFGRRVDSCERVQQLYVQIENLVHDLDPHFGRDPAEVSRSISSREDEFETAVWSAEVLATPPLYASLTELKRVVQNQLFDLGANTPTHASVGAALEAMGDQDSDFLTTCAREAGVPVTWQNELGDHFQQGDPGATPTP